MLTFWSTAELKRFNLSNHTAVGFHPQTVKLDRLMLCLTYNCTIFLFTTRVG